MDEINKIVNNINDLLSESLNVKHQSVWDEEYLSTSEEISTILSSLLSRHSAATLDEHFLSNSETGSEMLYCRLYEHANSEKEQKELEGIWNKIAVEFSNLRKLLIAPCISSNLSGIIHMGIDERFTEEYVYPVGIDGVTVDYGAKHFKGKELERIISQNILESAFCGGNIAEDGSTGFDDTARNLTHVEKYIDPLRSSVMINEGTKIYFYVPKNASMDYLKASYCGACNVGIEECDIHFLSSDRYHNWTKNKKILKEVEENILADDFIDSVQFYTDEILKDARDIARIGMEDKRVPELQKDIERMYNLIKEEIEELKREKTE